MGAWLKREGARDISLGSVCSLGRDVANDVALQDDRASRRHAIINRQGLEEYWLVDVGSTNGIQLKGRRLTRPTRLRSGDRFVVGATEFTFQQETSNAQTEEFSGGDTTIINPGLATQIARTQECWMLVADLVGFTTVSQKMSSAEAARLVSRWIGKCSAVFRQHRTEIQVYLGDGFLAYLPSEEKATFFKILAALRELQAEAQPPFRLVLHHGAVAVGGLAPDGAESILGEEVNKLFRLEKVAGKRQVACAMTKAAADQWKGRKPELVGRYVLKGFPRKESLYRLP